jgi:hypothetical protein
MRERLSEAIEVSSVPPPGVEYPPAPEKSRYVMPATTLFVRAMERKKLQQYSFWLPMILLASASAKQH